MSHARTKGKGPTGQEPLACTSRETEAWREKVLLHLNVASFCQTTPKAQEWRKQQRGQEGASDQEHTYWQGRLSGEHEGYPQKGGPPSPGSGEDSQLREGVGTGVPNPASSRSWVPISSALGPRLFQAQSGQEGTAERPGPSTQQAAWEIRPCPLWAQEPNCPGRRQGWSL